MTERSKTSVHATDATHEHKTNEKVYRRAGNTKLFEDLKNKMSQVNRICVITVYLAGL